jgi:hypothetical protein
MQLLLGASMLLLAIVSTMAACIKLAGLFSMYACEMRLIHVSFFFLQLANNETMIELNAN